MITGKDITIDKDGSIILNGDKYPLASQAEIDAVKGDIDEIEDNIGDITQTAITGASIADQLGVIGEILGFTHFVRIPYTTGVLESIEAAFENDTIPSDIMGLTIGMLRGQAGSQRVIFIAQNQTDKSTNQTRYAAIYFGAYTAPRFCQKQDNTAWTDVAL